MAERLIIPSTSIMVTEACTLKCKLCLAYSPYYREYHTMNKEEMEKILENYFAIVDEVEKLSITGGEPLLNPQLKDLINIIMSYADRIGKEIILITNGTLALSEDILEVLDKSDKVKVIVNHYGDISPYAEENYYKLCEKGIRSILYTEDNRYGWIDCRDHSLKHKTNQAVEKQARSCAFFLGKKYVINRGILYTCTRGGYRIQNQIIPYTDEDFIDLLGNVSIERNREKLLQWQEAKATVSCAYCDGLTENSQKYKAAEQLEDYKG